MVDRLTPQQIALLREQFKSFDQDGDGKLTKADTAAIMRSLGQNPNEAEIQAKHSEFDLDGNGTVEFPEYLSVMAKTMLSETVNDTEILEIFTMLDFNQDGYLDRKELSKGMACAAATGGVQEGAELSKEEVDDMLSEYDKDGDGKLSLEEFTHMMKSEIYGNGLSI